MYNELDITADENKKILKRIACILSVFLVLLVVNELTGVFTSIHLKNEDQMVEANNKPKMTDKFVDELIADSKSTLSWKRAEAARYLGKLHMTEKTIISTLNVLLKDEDAEVQKAAREALDNI